MNSPCSDFHFKKAKKMKKYNIDKDMMFNGLINVREKRG